MGFTSKRLNLRQKGRGAPLGPLYGDSYQEGANSRQQGANSQQGASDTGVSRQGVLIIVIIRRGLVVIIHWQPALYLKENSMHFLYTLQSAVWLSCRYRVYGLTSPSGPTIRPWASLSTACWWWTPCKHLEKTLSCSSPLIKTYGKQTWKYETNIKIRAKL